MKPKSFNECNILHFHEIINIACAGFFLANERIKQNGIYNYLDRKLGEYFSTHL